MSIHHNLTRIATAAALAGAAMLSTLEMYAQGGPRKVQGSFSYMAPLTMSVYEARSNALQNAIAQALANEFGTLVVQQTSGFAHVEQDSSYETFTMCNATEVKGEWLQTIGKPVYEYTINDDEMMINVTVEGLAREIKSTPISLDVKTLRNGLRDVDESQDFMDNDDFYMTFRSPVDGYLAIYMFDPDEEKAYQVLPYTGSDLPTFHVKGNRPYTLFSKAADPTAVEYQMSSDKLLSHTHIYVLFSPEEFTKAPSRHDPETGVSYLDKDEFMKWRTDLSKHDEKMNVRIYHLNVRNPKPIE